MHKEKGLTLLESIIATAIVAIGFLAVFQMVNYSVHSIGISSERTKANYLVAMVAEDLIGDKNNIISGTTKLKDQLLIDRDGTKQAWKRISLSNAMMMDLISLKKSGPSVPFYSNSSRTRQFKVSSTISTYSLRKSNSIGL